MKHARQTGLISIKKIIQKDLEGNTIDIFNGSGEIKRKLNINIKSILKCCNKEKGYNTAYGYKWEFYN